MYIGIDVGSTNSCVAVWDGRIPRVIELDDSGATILPSVVTIMDETVHVGQEAIEAGKRFPDFEFRNFKRRLAEEWLAMAENLERGQRTGN